MTVAMHDRTQGPSKVNRKSYFDADLGKFVHYFRQSWLGDLEICDERARLELVGEMPRVETDAAAVGTACHAGIEYVLHAWKASGVRPTELAGGGSAVLAGALENAHMEFVVISEMPNFAWKKYDNETAHRLIDTHVTNWWNQLLPNLAEPLEIEWEFDVPLLGNNRRIIRLTGTADYVDVNWRITDWKGLALDTRIPTPTGWTTMAELRVGDELFGANGAPCRVVGKSEVNERPCYEVRFDDGSAVIADNVHLWQVVTGPTEHAIEKVLNTEELLHLPGPHRVVNAAPLETPPVDLPLDPYLLGVWLGDGTTSSGSLTVSDTEPDIVERLRSLGEDVTLTRHETGCSIYRVVGLTKRLRALGLIGNKHVPAPYLRGSITQRLELLRGLLDTDGGWNATRNQAVFDSTTPGLSAAVYELVVSLGWRASCHRGQPTYPGSKKYDRVTFTPYGMNPFAVQRKAVLAEARMSGTVVSRRRVIKSILPVGVEPTQCIAVDSPDNLFLCGNAMVPTHNTSGRPYQQRSKQDNAIQPTVYTYAWARSHGQHEVNRPWYFDYGVMYHPKGKKDAYVDTVGVIRHRAHWDWLRQKCDAIAGMIEADLPAWPYKDDHFLCTELWCPAYSTCRGAVAPK